MSRMREYVQTSEICSREICIIRNFFFFVYDKNSYHLLTVRNSATGLVFSKARCIIFIWYLLNCRFYTNVVKQTVSKKPLVITKDTKTPVCDRKINYNCKWSNSKSSKSFQLTSNQNVYWKQSLWRLDWELDRNIYKG